MTIDPTPSCLPPQVVTAVMAARAQADDSSFADSPVWVHASYDPEDPYAVRLLFLNFPEQPLYQGTEWVVSREVLWSASELRQRDGMGDVQVEYSASCSEVIMHLSSPDSGEQTRQVRLPHGRLSVFLRQAVELVPLGSESDHVQIDKLIDICLGGGR